MNEARADRPRGFSAMSEYERRAWDASIRRLHAPDSGMRQRFSGYARAASERATPLTSKMAGFADEHLPVEAVQSIVTKALDGTLDLTFNPALRSANVDKVVAGHREKRPDIESAMDLRRLDLQELDGFRRRRGAYVAASAVQGGATSLAVTGTVVSTTVSGGITAGAAVGAIAADTVASLAGLGRTIGSVAVRYGYDVRLPDEEYYAMGVMTLGIASSGPAKIQALSALSRLTQQMMRRTAWAQLNKHGVVRAISKVYGMLGLRLTQRKLAQVVPLVGVGLNMGLNANMTKAAYTRAEDVYRLRFLSEKYGISPEEWMGRAEPGSVETEDAQELPDVAEILAEETDTVGDTLMS